MQLIATKRRHNDCSLTTKAQGKDPLSKQRETKIQKQKEE